MGILSDAALATAADLADAFGVPLEALRKRLDRWREKNAAGGDWIENPEAASRTARYLYRIGRVRPLIDALGASGEPRLVE